MNTLLLNPQNWDLLLDSSGNIAMATEPYANAQDVGSAIKLFAGEQFYDTDQGMPYFDQILGHNPPVNFVAAQAEAVALTVPNIVSAKATLAQNTKRQITGKVEVINTLGKTNNVAFP